MQSLLVISDEPALAETLASELTEFTVAGIHSDAAGNHVHSKKFCLIIIDNASNYSIDNEIKNIIRLPRPIRLCDAVYTIRQHVKSKTVTLREELEIIPGCIFLVPDRLICRATRNISIVLTDKETDLLQHLVKNNTHILSREFLLKQVWGYGGDIHTHTLETHIYRLRTKLKQLDEDLDIVFSEEGGYELK